MLWGLCVTVSAFDAPNGIFRCFDEGARAGFAVRFHQRVPHFTFVDPRLLRFQAAGRID